MFLRELYEAPSKTAVLAFGRLNPPTVGHAKLVDKIKSIKGDHYLFLSQTQKPKTDPLDFATKLKFAKQFFPGVNVGHQSVRTPVQALEMLQSLGYTDVVFIAGSDRVDGFQAMFDKYNGQPDKSGNIPFKFNTLKVVSAGERDPDADDVSGMSASKMRAAAAAGELETFAKGVPDAKLAQTMYDAVRKGMGVKDAETVDESEQLNEWVWLIPALATAARIGASAVAKLGTKEIAKQAAKTVAKNGAKAATATGKAIIKNPGKSALAVGSYEVYDTVSDAMEWLEELDVAEDLIKPLAMVMVQYAIPVAAILAVLYGGAKLYDYFKDDKKDLKTAEDVSPEDEKEFHNALDDLVHKYFGDSPDEEKMKKKMKKVKPSKETNEILGFATKNQKKTTIKKKRPPEEDSVKDKLAKRRAMAAKGDPKAYKSGSLDEGSPISDLKKIIGSKVYKQEYLMALKMMKQEAISAADAARRFMHVDARTLDKMAEKMGV